MSQDCGLGAYSKAGAVSKKCPGQGDSRLDREVGTSAEIVQRVCSRMPASFHQSNINTEEFKSFQEAEIFSAADFILNESGRLRSRCVHLPLGNAAKVEGELFLSSDVSRCHGMNDFQQTHYGQAPNLSTIGSKVTKDWLLS